MLPPILLLLSSGLAALLGYKVGVEITKEKAKEHMDPDSYKDFEEECNEETCDEDTQVAKP